MLEITSKDNARLKTARAARDGRLRDLIFIEGLRLAEEAVAANLKIVDYFFTPDFAKDERAANLLEQLSEFDGAVVSAKLLEGIADTKTPQGIVLLAEKPAARGLVGKKGKSEKGQKGDEFENVEEFANFSPFPPLPFFPTNSPFFPALIVILHRINNPNNVGAILRAAEAAGAAGAILTGNSADAFAPKSLRAAMGSAFRLPIWTNAEFTAAIEFCRASNLKIVCAELNAAQNHTEIDWTIPRALVIGSEAHGLTAAEIKMCDENLRIPMQPPVESLNAAVAAGIVLYEANRQKAVQSPKSKVQS